MLYIESGIASLPARPCLLPTSKSRLSSIPWKDLVFNSICDFIRKTKAHKYSSQTRDDCPVRQQDASAPSSQSTPLGCPEQHYTAETKQASCIPLLSTSPRCSKLNVTLSYRISTRINITGTEQKWTAGPCCSIHLKLRSVYKVPDLSHVK